MYTQVEKTKENKSRAVANSVFQKKNNVNQGFGFLDNRIETVLQRKVAVSRYEANTKTEDESTINKRGNSPLLQRKAPSPFFDKSDDGQVERTSKTLRSWNGEHSHNAIQRYPLIGEEGEGAVEATEWSTISAFIKRHNLHVFHGYSVDTAQEDGVNPIFSKINGTFKGAAGAKQLSEKLLTLLNTALVDTHNPLGQKQIIRKLAEITELVRSTRFDLEGDRLRALEVSKQLYHDSGLCYGFTEIFKRHSAWEEALWRSISLWKPSGGSTQDELDKLNDHLQKTINWAPGDPNTNALEATLMLKEAWEYMEQKDQYHNLPAALNDLTGTPPDSEPISIGQTTRLIKSKQDVSQLVISVAKQVQSLESMPPGLVIEISTDMHSMMASFQKGKIIFCEPEYWGIVSCTWEELANKLWGTIEKIHSHELVEGTALDMDVHAQVPKAQEDVSSDEVTSLSAPSSEIGGILSGLRVESQSTFKGLAESSDPVKFIKEYNSQMYDLLFPD